MDEQTKKQWHENNEKINEYLLSQGYEEPEREKETDLIPAWCFNQ